ncbi:MAG: RNase adapter RapZ [Elusimicrobia bacterium CG08_land_8_20_14_0_20_44_26]|nr:MAG: RNase adapter RapZ [Elusimicrobia bacterium CG08_land_8_20_14_0_20_44_26]
MPTVIITGISGAGKTLALKFMQDLGYFCVDNLPVNLMERFFSEERRRHGKLAVGIDIREKKHFPLFLKITAKIKPHKIIFLECSTEELVRRFKANRRKPPLARANQNIFSALGKERIIFEKIKAVSDMVIDTSELNPWQMKQKLLERLSFAGGAFQIDILSFGYRFGVPSEADMIYDVRFLPNPNYNRLLAPLSGEHPKISKFVSGSALYKKTLNKAAEFLRMILPAYKETGKSYFTVAVGCTGGRHRSVVFAEGIRKKLSGEYGTKVFHRDIRKGITER